MSDTHGTVCWTELITNDVEAAKAYYTKTCGWQVNTVDMGMGDYHLFMKGEEIICGMSAAMPDMGQVPDHWVTYFAVDDVDAAVAASKAMGAKVLMEPTDIPETGRVAMLHDPSGAPMGLMTPSG